MNFKQRLMIIAIACSFIHVAVAAVDMQAHVASDEGKAAYTAYIAKQNAYYQGIFSYQSLMALIGDPLFGAVNTLMGNTCLLERGSYDYGKLRYSYIDVDKDLNTSGNIIGYYDGRSMSGTWGTGYNREHTWPQSKGANKNITMGHDMQSVRPTSTSVNSDRGNTAYGEGVNYYDPNDVKINNTNYKTINMGSYRGDAARVILYDYIVYGSVGNYKNSLFNGNAQLLNKLGTEGVFESLTILVKWHMQDPPSLTEMVRNDGAQQYQGNRNPFIDYPELVIQMFKNNASITTYNVQYTTDATVQPRYAYTTKDGFITYLSYADGTHPQTVTVTGAKATYDPTLGRLIVTNATSNVGIQTAIMSDLIDTTTPIGTTQKIMKDGHLLIKQGETYYNIYGERVRQLD